MVSETRVSFGWLCALFAVKPGRPAPGRIPPVRPRRSALRSVPAQRGQTLCRERPRLLTPTHVSPPHGQTERQACHRKDTEASLPGCTRSAGTAGAVSGTAASACVGAPSSPHARLPCSSNHLHKQSSVYRLGEPSLQRSGFSCVPGCLEPKPLPRPCLSLPARSPIPWPTSSSCRLREAPHSAMYSAEV